MNLHQFRFVQEAARRNLNLTETARALHTSQPGISKAILELEEELGIDIFTRHGKRLTRITEPGRQVLGSIEVILREVANLKRIGEEYSQQEVGTLSVATTHTQARYVLPEPVAELRQRFPRVSVSLHQGTPQQVVRMLLDDEADIGIATEALDRYDELISLPCYDWQHVAVFPADHPLVAPGRPERLTLEDLAAWPLVTYHLAFSGRSRIDAAFAQAHLHPQVALEAIDADVIKTYVRLGLGIGLVAEMAVRDDPAFMASPELPAALVTRPVGHLFGRNTTRIAFKKGAYLRQFVLVLAELLSPHLDHTLLTRLLADPQAGQGSAPGYDL